MDEKITILKGGRNTQSIYRKGDKVYRSRCANYEFVHSVLRHLEIAGFTYAPRFLGMDDHGNEILTFIQGEVPRSNPLTFDQKLQAIKILRTFHDILSNFAAKGECDTICHNDFAPWNLIVNNDNIAGIIDFDDCAPGNRIEDVAYFIWTALDLGISEDSDQVQIESLAKLVNAYQLVERHALIPAIIHQQERILAFREDIVANTNDHEKLNFSKGAISRILKSRRWVERNIAAIEQAILFT